MTASRVLVAPPWTQADARGGVIAAALLGSIAGAASGAVIGGSVVERVVSVLACYFAPPLLFGAASVAVTHRKSPLFWRGVVLWTSQFLVFLFASSLFSPARGADMLVWQALWPIPIVAVVLGALGGGIHLGLRWLARISLFEIREQDGMTCWRCAYQMGSPTITVCPECGTPIDLARYRLAPVWRASAWLNRESVRLAVVSCIIAILFASPTLVTHTVPNARFLWTFRAGELGSGIADGNRGSISTPGVGRFVPAALGDPDHLLLTYTPSDSDGVPAMTAQAGSFGVTADGDSYFDHGAPWIRWDFTRRQAEYVARFGLPPKFLELVRRTLAEEQWRPAIRSALSIRPAGDSVPDYR